MKQVRTLKAIIRGRLVFALSAACHKKTTQKPRIILRKSKEQPLLKSLHDLRSVIRKRELSATAILIKAKRAHLLTLPRF